MFYTQHILVFAGARVNSDTRADVSDLAQRIA